jgi:hypothetical protein
MKFIPCFRSKLSIRFSVFKTAVLVINLASQFNRTDPIKTVTFI